MVEAFPRVTCHIVFHIVTFVITVLVAYFSVLHTTYDQSVRRARVNLEQTCWIDHLHSAHLSENASLNKRFHPSSAICLRYNLRWYSTRNSSLLADILYSKYTFLGKKGHASPPLSLIKIRVKFTFGNYTLSKGGKKVIVPFLGATSYFFIFEK